MPGSGSKSRKAKPVVWSEQAKEDLERIFVHIADGFTVELAVEITNRLVDGVEALSCFPRKGSISPNFSGIRELILDSNTVYYRENESDIVIASVRPRRTATKKNI
jgi:plasmid stabilization system protein ParE